MQNQIKTKLKLNQYKKIKIVIDNWKSSPKFVHWNLRCRLPSECKSPSSSNISFSIRTSCWSSSSNWRLRKKTFIFASAKPEKSKNFHWTYIWIFPNSFCTSSSSKTSSSPASFSSSSKFCSFSSSLPHSDSDNSASFSKNSAAFCFVIISSSEL